MLRFCHDYPGTKKSSDPVEVLHSLPTVSQNPITESSIYSSMKLKLQLFPIDDGTRRALELVGTENNYVEIINAERNEMLLGEQLIFCFHMFIG